MPSDQAALQRCEEEIAEAERLLRAGHPDVEGLALALSDWSLAKRIIEARIEALGRL